MAGCCCKVENISSSALKKDTQREERRGCRGKRDEKTNKNREGKRKESTNRSSPMQRTKGG
jgi:hypothetical protein